MSNASNRIESLQIQGYIERMNWFLRDGTNTREFKENSLNEVDAMYWRYQRGMLKKTLSQPADIQAATR